MTKPYIFRSIFFLLLADGLALSCMNHPKEYTDFTYKAENVKSDPPVIFNLIDCLNESNKKVISLASTTFLQNKDPQTLQLLLDITKDQQKIDSDLKNLTEKNLIIIPRHLPPAPVTPDSLKGKKLNVFLLKTLESEIGNQILILNHLEKSSENSGFKIFSKKARKIMETHKKELDKTINT